MDVSVYNVDGFQRYWRNLATNAGIRRAPGHLGTWSLVRKKSMHVSRSTPLVQRILHDNLHLQSVALFPVLPLLNLPQFSPPPPFSTVSTPLAPFTLFWDPDRPAPNLFLIAPP